MSAVGASNNEGNEFYLIMPPNKGMKLDPEIYVSTREKRPVNFSVSWFHAREEISRSHTAHRGQFTSVRIPAYLEIDPASPFDSNISVTVKAEGSKTVMVYGLTEEYASTDGWLALPRITNKLGSYEYFAVTTKRSTVPYVYNVYSYMGIVVTEDNTTVEITPRNTVVTKFGRQVKLLDGRTYSAVFPKEYTIAVSSQSDITGTHVVADKPLTVISGHQCGTVPHNFSACDVMVEHIPPTDTWGFTFVLVPLSTRITNGFSFTASRPNTTIAIRCNNRNGQVNYWEDIRLARAGDHRLVIYPTTRYCWVKSNLPLLVVQYALGHSVDNQVLSNTQSDPFMTIIPPLEQYTNEFSLHFFDSIDGKTNNLEVSFSPWVNLIVMAEYYNLEEFRINNQAFSSNTTSFTPIMCEEGKICAYAGQLKPKRNYGSYHLQHMNPMAKCAATVYGWERENTYGYPAGFQLDSVAGMYVSRCVRVCVCVCACVHVCA